MTLSPPVLATRAGRCPGCMGAIRKDELIVKDEKTDRWFHPECAPETAREAGVETPHVFWSCDASKVIDRLEQMVRQPTLGRM